MKNLKKVLALAVAFVMCFTMFAGAAVYSDVPAGSDYSEAVTLLSDLGVIAGMPDGSFGVDKTITRADAACLIARMMTGETMPSKYAGASNFTDVPKDAYYESAVAYCAIEGITSGTSTTLGTYSPSREITDGEFIAMITRALGYDSAENPLSFPMGNIARAQQEGILDNVNVVADSPALRGEDAMMIYNALFADWDKYAKQKNIYQAADEHTSYTIAHEVFGLDRLARLKDGDEEYKEDIKGNQQCLSHTWVVAGVDPRNGVNTYTAFPINDKTNKIADIEDIEALDEETKPITFIYEGDPSSILGYQVELWGEKAHNGVDEIIKAVKTVKGQTGYDWKLGDGEDGSDKLTVSGGTVDAEEAPVAVANLMTEDAAKGDEKEGIHTEIDEDEAAFRLYQFDRDIKDSIDDWDFKDGDSYRMVDWDSDGKIDFAIKTTRKYAEITNIDKDDITFTGIVDNKEQELTYEISDDQLKFACEGIEEGDVVEMTVSRAYDKGQDGEIVTINVEKVSSQIAELTKVSTKGELEMTFDGVVRKMAQGDDAWDLVEDENNNLDESDLEGTYEIWLDENGFIVKLEESDTNSGYLVALELEDGEKKTTKARSERAVMKAILDDNTVDAFEVAFDLDIVGTVYDSNNKMLEKRNINTTGYYNLPDSTDPTKVLYNKDYEWVAEELVVGQVYKYWMDSDKVITKLQRVAENATRQESYWGNTGVVKVVGSKVTDNKGYEFNGNVYLKRADVLFITDNDFVTYTTKKDGSFKAVADEDLVLSIEPTTANLKAIANDDVGRNILRLAETQAIPGSGAPSELLYRLVNSNAAVSVSNIADIAYDLDKDSYATSAIMTISNFPEFDKRTTVALITDASAQNRKNTVFEIDGAVAGKVGTFTSVEEDDGASALFYKYEPNYASNNTDWNKDWTRPYSNLTAVRDDIDDNGVYAEVSMNADGKITKVVIMTEDNLGNVVGPNYAVVRLGAGINMEVAKEGTAAFIADNAGNNILRFANSDNLYSRESVEWRWSYGVTGNTNIYTISNKLKDIISDDQYSLLKAGKNGLTNMNDEPKIKEATAADITSSTNRNSTSKDVDKYAVMDVAFDVDDILVKTTGNTADAAGYYTNETTFAWNHNAGTMGYAIDNDDAVAVFSYTKRFGETDATPAIAMTSSGEYELDKVTGTQTADFVVEYEELNDASYAKAELLDPNGKAVASSAIDDTATPGEIKIQASTFNNLPGEWILRVTDADGKTYDHKIKVTHNVGNAKLNSSAQKGTVEAGSGNTATFTLKNASGAAPAAVSVVAVDTKGVNTSDFTQTYNTTTGDLDLVVGGGVPAGEHTLTLRDSTTGATTKVTLTVEGKKFDADTAAGTFNGKTITITGLESGAYTAKDIESVTVNDEEIAVTNFTESSGAVKLTVTDDIPVNATVVVKFAATDLLTAGEVECTFQ